MSVAISIRGLSKSYEIRHKRSQSYVTLRDVLSAGARQFGKRLFRPYVKSHARSDSEVFMALRDVNVEIQKGERVGIIGRNGAGKSTLLKILSRITEPTKGRIEIHGRVSSLLEVGTGFHPELTGRENIFLNGTILGMSARDIRRKFDEIVAFAEVERFLDTPVKRYSSGMYVRLAFAVSAHLEPDILIVDEVLAVGDVQFQRKCLGKMGEVSREGRTILFVTHNMDALSALCSRAVILDKGAVRFSGSVASAREMYLGDARERVHSLDDNSGRGGSGGVRIEEVLIEDPAGNKVDQVGPDTGLTLRLRAVAEEGFSGIGQLDVAFGIDTIEGQRIFTVISSWKSIAFRADPVLDAACDFESMPLVPGRYLVSASILLRGDTLDSIQHCAQFEVFSPQGESFNERSESFGPLDLPCRFRDVA